MFGPAQALHGATLIVDAAFIADTLDVNGLVIDIDKAQKSLKSCSTPLNYRNLDESTRPNKTANTTTEFLSKYIFDRLAEVARAGILGRDARELKAIKVTISESHIARAWYEAPL